MDEVSGPVIAVGLVLSAVFVPCAFITGITGQFFRQFALTIAVVDGHLDVQLADAEPGPGGAAAAADAATRSGATPLPRLAFVLIGGLARLRVPGPVADARGLDRALGGCSAGADSAIDVWWTAVGARRGGRRRRGRLGRRPAVELGCSASFFRLFNAGFRRGDERLHAGSSAACSAVSVLVLVVYGGLLYLTYWRLHDHAHRVHPVAGHGLPAGQRPAARLGVAGADRRR